MIAPAADVLWSLLQVMFIHAFSGHVCWQLALRLSVFSVWRVSWLLLWSMFVIAVGRRSTSRARAAAANKCECLRQTLLTKQLAGKAQPCVRQACVSLRQHAPTSTLFAMILSVALMVTNSTSEDKSMFHMTLQVDSWQIHLWVSCALACCACDAHRGPSGRQLGVILCWDIVCC